MKRLAVWGFFGFCAAVLVVSGARAQGPAASPDWNRFRFLIGEWVGEGSGQPGEGSGGFTFSTDLQGRILVRKNFADYPATKDRPAFRHDDLMVTWHGGDTTASADYFDSEGHVIRYRVTANPDSGSWMWQSEPSAGSPGYRLTYTRIDDSRLKISFDIAPPGKPFVPYIKATAHRKSQSHE